MLFFYLFTLITNITIGQTVKQFDKMEVNIMLNNLQPSEIALISSKNPFDKDEIQLKVIITKPDNTIDEINGFYFEDFAINFDQNNHHSKWPNLPHEYLTANNSPFRKTLNH